MIKTKYATLRNNDTYFKDQTHNIYKQEANEYQRLYNNFMRS